METARQGERVAVDLLIANGICYESLVFSLLKLILKQCSYAPFLGLNIDQVVHVRYYPEAK